MADVEIYTTMLCGFCARAKKLLSAKGVDFREIDVTLHPSRRAEMMERSGGNRKVPQIFIDGAHIGGSQELDALDDSGRLDLVLGVKL